MLASAEWESVGLAATRLISTIVSTGALVVLATIWKRQPPPAERIVPRAILIFTMGWLAVLTTITSTLVITEREAVADGAERVIYGMSFVWSIFGLAWIVWYGQVAIWKAREINRAVTKDDGNET